MNHQDWLEETTSSPIPMYSPGNPIAYDNCDEGGYDNEEHSPPSREEAVRFAYEDLKRLIDAVDSEKPERVMVAREVALWSLTALTRAFPEVFKTVDPPPADEDDYEFF